MQSDFSPDFVNRHLNQSLLVCSLLIQLVCSQTGWIIQDRLIRKIVYRIRIINEKVYHDNTPGPSSTLV